MISGGREVNLFAEIRLTLKVEFLATIANHFNNSINEGSLQK